MVEKSTTNSDSNRINLLQVLAKTQGGKYMAVLSDTSVDRDGEMVGEEAFVKMQNDTGSISILVDHENTVKNLVGEWVNRRVDTIDGHTAFVAEPKFFLSNPLAQMIKGMLDEGAKIGISIGAIVKNSVEKSIDGVKRRVFTDLEILEASFVGIPSNRSGMAMAVAKSFINKPEENKMSEETYTVKQFQAEVDARTDAETKFASVTKDLEDSKSEVASLTAQIEKAKTEADEALIKKVEDAEAEIVQTKKDLDAAKAKIEALEKSPAPKAQDAGEFSEEVNAEAQLAKGYLPVIRV